MARKLYTFERPDGATVDVEVPETVNDFPDTIAYPTAGQVIVHLPIKHPDTGADVITVVTWDRVPDDWKLVGGETDGDLPGSVVTTGEPAKPEPVVDPDVLLKEVRRIDPNIGNGPLGAIEGKTPGGPVDIDELPEHMRDGRGGWYYITDPEGGDDHKVQTKAAALDLYATLYPQADS